MKMVIRADDVGYSEVNDIGALRALTEGVATAADVMLDAPHAAGVLEKLKEMPWISVGWHPHFWCAPVLPAEEVPSLVMENGRFRHDLRMAEDADDGELLAECEAQMALCRAHLGRMPDTGPAFAGGSSPFARALRATCEKYGLPAGFLGYGQRSAEGRWAEKKLLPVGFEHAYDALMADDLEAYSPLRFYLEDQGHLLEQPEDVIAVQYWHPGYLDHYNYREGDYGPHAAKFTLCRIIDAHDLCAPELKAWIREHGIELVNFRDALYGTRTYQAHLAQTGSPLCVLG